MLIVVAASSHQQQRPLATAAPYEPRAHPWASAALGCLAAALLSAAPAPAEAKDLVEGFPKVVDGDTLDFSGTRVRLFGIDAPETKQSCTANKGGEYMCGEQCSACLWKAPVRFSWVWCHRHAAGAPGGEHALYTWMESLASRVHHLAPPDLRCRRRALQAGAA